MLLKLPIYLDYNATTPVDQEVLEEILPYFSQKFGNPSSAAHAFGWEPSAAIEIAREQIAQTLRADPKEITFTSGATEALNLAIKGLAEIYSKKGKHIITAATEHRAVLDTCAAMEKNGFKITRLPVDGLGQVNPEQLAETISPETILVVLMYGNNETGTLFPIPEISRIVHEKNSFLLCDATQALGKIEVNVKELGVDMLTISSHKIYGPKGAGALYVRSQNPELKLSPLIHGGGQEKGLRSGTLNVPAIVGFGKAAGISTEILAVENKRLEELRDGFEKKLKEIHPITIHGDLQNRLPNTSQIAFQEGISPLKLFYKLAISPGSACNSSQAQTSHVLKAMNVFDKMARASVRFSFGKFTTEAEIDFALEHIAEQLARH